MDELLRTYVKSNQSQMFSLLKKMVDINSGSRNKRGVDAVGHVVTDALTGCDLAVEVIEEAHIGNQLVVRSPCPSFDAGQILMVGHMDTVFGAGTKFTNYREDDTRAYGPGVIDMKGGLVAGIFAIKALSAIGLLKRIPLVFIFNSDEEIGSGRSKDLICHEAGQSACAFVLESGGSRGEVVTARKGNLSARLTIKGRAGHAAFAGADKASAILEMAHLTLAIEALNDPTRGISANVGKVSGGTTPNTVAEHAEARLDFRFNRSEDGDKLKNRLTRIAAHKRVAGTTATLEIVTGRPPMPDGGLNRHLYSRVEKIANRLGIAIGAEFRPGVSDANQIAQAGVPVVDGLGPIGGGDHSPDEYMIKSSLPQRTLLLAAILADFSRA
jgi:glutamate carboxypeptidase